MKVAFGLRAHSGWAALVSVGMSHGDFVVSERRRIELVDEAWAKQPYHAAEDRAGPAAKQTVKKGIGSVHRIARRELTSAVKRENAAGNEVVACGVLMGEPMPDWTVE